MTKDIKIAYINVLFLVLSQLPAHIIKKLGISGRKQCALILNEEATIIAIIRIMLELI